MNNDGVFKISIDNEEIIQIKMDNWAKDIKRIMKNILIYLMLYLALEILVKQWKLFNMIYRHY